MQDASKVAFWQAGLSTERPIISSIRPLCLVVNGAVVICLRLEELECVGTKFGLSTAACAAACRAHLTGALQDATLLPNESEAGVDAPE